MRNFALTAAVLVAACGSALAGSDTPPPSGMVVLNHNASGALTMVGNSRIEIPSKAVYVNSSSNSAVSTTGQAILDAPMLYVVGKANFNGQSQCTGTVCGSVAPYADPCSGATFPATQGMTDHGGRSIEAESTVTLSPGYYSGGIRIAGNSTVTFAPGVYMIGGDGLRVTSGQVRGEGVTLVVCAGSLDIAGASTLELSPPDSGSTQGLVIAQPAANTNEARLAGGSGTLVTGTIYIPKARLVLTGGSLVEGQEPQMGDIVVADRVSLSGQGTIRIGQESAPSISLPSLPLFD